MYRVRQAVLQTTIFGTLRLSVRARADMTRDCIAEVVEDGEAVEFIDARLARETDRAVQIACPPVVMIHIAERDPEGGLAVREASEAMLALHPLLIKRGQKVSKLSRNAHPRPSPSRMSEGCRASK